MKNLTLSMLASLLTLALHCEASACDAVQPNMKLPISVGGYTISNMTAGMSTSTGQNGTIELNGGLKIDFDNEHVGTIFEFAGGSVGDVEVRATGGVFSSTVIVVPKTAGATTKAALYTKGVSSLTLESQNNEGTLITICSAE